MAANNIGGAFGDVLSKAGKNFGDAMESAVTGKKINGTNKAISSIGNFTGVAEAAGKFMRDGDFTDALSSTFKHKGGTKDGQLNVGKIAGSYLGAAAAGRVVTGGGVYKDGQGRTNLVGVPFV